MNNPSQPLDLALTEGLGPLLVEADMDALTAVAEQAGLKGIDLHALARVLDAAQRVAVAAERERCAKACIELAALSWAAADAATHNAEKAKHESVAAAMEALAGDLKA